MRALRGGKAEDEPTTLAELRKTLPKGHRAIVKLVLEKIEEELIDVLPELNAAVQRGNGEGSFSTTLQISRAKKGRFKATVSAKVRSPREKIELDMHIDADGQLSLGLPAGFNESDPAAEGGGEGGGDVE